MCTVFPCASDSPKRTLQFPSVSVLRSSKESPIEADKFDGQ